MSIVEIRCPRCGSEECQRSEKAGEYQCDHCGTIFRFTRTAGKEKTLEAGRHKRKLAPPTIGDYNIVCPHCSSQNRYSLSGDHTDISCSSCNGRFRVFLATVRAKRGRKSGMMREYVIRTITHAGEGEHRFVDYGGSDLDLRSGDTMYACYKIDADGGADRSPSILANQTIHQYAAIKPQKKGCFIATVACGYGSWEVKALSKFRDDILSESRSGRLSIRLYYLVSPFLALLVCERQRTKNILSKCVVSPIATFISKIFHEC